MSQLAGSTKPTDSLTTSRDSFVEPETAKPALRIVFASDGSDEAGAAVRFLERMPIPAGSAIQALTVVDAMGSPETPIWYLESGREWARKTVEDTCGLLARPGVEVNGGIRFGARGYEIIQAAEEFEADLLVLAAHEHSRLEAFWLGSISRSVAKHARCPVLIARKPEHDLHRVVLAVDESEHSIQAADFVAGLPLPARTEVTVLHVVRPYQPFPGLVPSDPTGFQREVESVRRKHQEAGQGLVQRIGSRLEGAGKRVTTVLREGDPSEEVLKLAQEQKADLVVTGARGVSMIQGLLLGSVADRVLDAARCSVLLVR